MHPRLLVVVSSVAVATLGAAALAPAPAQAFCGFYINSDGGAMYNDATQVVLMRQGTRTVLSMQNAYKGPVEDFAMVVPVPTVLAETDVKILPADVFGRVDLMGSPRLVEYWEQDPCSTHGYGYGRGVGRGAGAAKPSSKSKKDADDHGVTIEAEFEVGEYQILILSAKESTGLDTWLRESDYKIPDKAEALLRPYVEAGSKFFVAKVDPAKVTFAGKRAMLSPLRFHYDSEEFSLPIRLGLANSAGTQDLIVNIIANERYEVANYDNVTIPTNIEVKDAVRKRFGEFYAALFDRTLEKHPGAVVTEYAWTASTCDPCPGPTLGPGDFATLGADVLDGAATTGKSKGGGRGGRFNGGGYVLTRLHARYGKKDMKDDLVFKSADPIVGGREFLQDNGKLEEGAREDSINNFQARYAIRHRWTGKIKCKSPQRGIWGGPPNGDQIAAPTQGAQNLAFAPRGKLKLRSMVAQNVPEIGLKMAKKKKVKKKPVPAAPAKAPKAGSGSGSSGSLSPDRAPGPEFNARTGAAAGLGGLVMLGGLALRRRRRR